MSTDNLNIDPDDADRLAELGQRAMARPAETIRLREEINLRRKRIAHGAAALIQREDDTLDDLDEIEDQDERIARRARLLLEAEPNRDDLDDEPAQPRQACQPEPTCREQQPRDGDTAVMPRVPAPAAQPADDRHAVVDIRHWSPIQWILAAVGLLIAALVLSVVHGGHHWWVTWAGWCGIGFFGGGLLGAFIDRWGDNHPPRR